MRLLWLNLDVDGGGVTSLINDKYNSTNISFHSTSGAQTQQKQMRLFLCDMDVDGLLSDVTGNKV